MNWAWRNKFSAIICPISNTNAEKNWKRWVIGRSCPVAIQLLDLIPSFKKEIVQRPHCGTRGGTLVTCWTPLSHKKKLLLLFPCGHLLATAFLHLDGHKHLSESKSFLQPPAFLPYNFSVMIVPLNFPWATDRQKKKTHGIIKMFLIPHNYYQVVISVCRLVQSIVPPGNNTWLKSNTQDIHIKEREGKTRGEKKKKKRCCEKASGLRGHHYNSGVLPCVCGPRRIQQEMLEGGGMGFSR